MTGGYAVKVNIFVQSYIVFLATVFIGGFGYNHIVTCGNSGVLLSKLFNIVYTGIQVLDIGLVLSNVCCVLIDVSSVSCDICFILIDISSVSCNVCFVFGYAVIQCCDICFVLIDVSSVSCNILIGLMQLAAVDSVSRGAADFACSYAADLAVLINGNLIVNLNIAAVQNDGGSAVRNLVAGYVDVCQLAALVSIYAIFGCNVAGGFDSTVGTADVYIFAGQVTKHDILVQVNLVNLLTVIIKFFNIDVGAVYHFAVFACFGCYCMQLAAVYSVSRISGDCTCCDAGNLAVFSNSYFTKLSAFSINVAVVTVIIGE